MVGPPINFYGSDTYHMSSIVGTYEYILYTGDTDFLSTNWDKIVLAVGFVTGKLDSTSLLDVTGTNDWGRYTQGGHNTMANAFMYATLTKGATMANWTSNPETAATWTAQAAALKAAINSASLNWDPTIGAFKDSDTDASVYPEDGNSLALLYDMADSSVVQNISTYLTTNWTPIGAACPELPNNIVPYVESMEIKGHFAASQATRALNLMRLSWGWYLNNPNGTGSTFPEGYRTDGSFGYRADSGYGGDYSYTSHAHGWSTGPTHALSNYVLGLQFASPGGASWVLAPQFGDLSAVEGGFTSVLGKFSAGWSKGDEGYSAWWDMPTGTNGTLVLPAEEGSAVQVDSVAVEGVYDSVSSTVAIGGVVGGAHNISVVY